MSENYLWSAGGLPVTDWRILHQAGTATFTVGALNSEDTAHLAAALREGDTVRITVEKPPFKPGYYRFKGAKGFSGSNHFDVKWHNSPPWNAPFAIGLASTLTRDESNWERVEVKSA